MHPSTSASTSIATSTSTSTSTSTPTYTYTSTSTSFSTSTSGEYFVMDEDTGVISASTSLKTDATMFSFILADLI